MKNLKINNKLKIILGTGIVTFSLITTGCSSKSHTITEQTMTPTESQNIESSETNDKENSFDNFETEKNTLDSLIYTENFELVDAVWHEYFIDAIDFIFYDKEYKDTKFSELNPEAQLKVIENIRSMGNTMNELFPNWKDDLNDIKGATIDFYYVALDEIKNFIGEDNYNAIKELKDGLKAGLKDLGDGLINKAEEWYQEYKENHK